MKRVLSLIAGLALTFIAQPALADKSFERVIREHYPVTGPVRIENGYQVHYPHGWTLKKHHYGSYMSPDRTHRHIIVRPNKYYGHHNHKDGLDRAEQAIDIAVKIAVLKEILKD